MSRPASRGEFDSLQSTFADVAANANKDPIERIAVLTYEFDDQQLINLIAGRRLDDEFDLRTNHLRFIAACQPLVLYDARKTRESNKLPHFLDLIPVRAKAYSCHHSKAYLIVTRDTVRLVLGSFNLTQTGLFSNREVFMDFLWSERERANPGLLRSFVALLRSGYANQAQAAASPALASIVALLAGRLDRWKMAGDGAASGDAYTLLASGYAEGESGLRQLVRLWRQVSDHPPRKLTVVSPFFDKGSSFLADALGGELGPIPEIVIHTDAENVAALSQRHYGMHAATRRLHLIPKAIGDEELVRIAAANDGAAVGTLNISRKLHAKILVLSGEGQRHLVYIGSANFTSKAWNGDNHELGLAWMHKGSADEIVASVVRAIGSAQACSYAQLPERIEQAEREEDVLYEDASGHLDFIRDIELRSSDGLETVAFHFSCDEPERLRDYDIDWGDVRITPAGTVSQPIPWSASAIALLGKRNLRFVRHGCAEPVFYLPFHHAPELLAYADLRLFANPEDWLLYYLRPQYAGGGGPGERVPGEPPETEDADDAPVDRESNVVIAMQRHLSLFAEVERVFDQRVADIARLPDCAEQWARSVEKPLLLYARLLDKERDDSSSPLRHQVHSFKTGELALFCHALGARLPAMRALARQLGEGLAPRRTDPPVLKTYLEHCRSELT
jgi:HKD family nuclease